MDTIALLAKQLAACVPTEHSGGKSKFINY